MLYLLTIVFLLASPALSELGQTDILSDANPEVHELAGPSGTSAHLFGASGTMTCGAGQTGYYLPQQSGTYPTNMPRPNLTCSGRSISNCLICIPSNPYYITPGQSNNFRISVYCPSNKQRTYVTWQTYGSSYVSGSFTAYPQADFNGYVSCGGYSDNGWIRYEWCDGSNNYGAYVMQYYGQQPQCQPYCASNTCGGSDGCGGTCNNCNSGYSCSNKKCVAQCYPTYRTNGCGDDGCGGTYNNCTSGYGCSNGQCVCQPYCASNTCGVSDGCGGTCNNCNSGYGCSNKRCVAQCYPTYRTNGCGDDGCGGTYNNCTSGYGCSNGQCVCQPYCASNTCGVSNGCGGTCNNCNSGYSCSNKKCVAQCYPSCGTNTCGSDGCGGTCNNCYSGYTCSNGQCVAPCTPRCTANSYTTCGGSDGCGGTCNNCASGYTCSNKRCVSNCYPTYRTNGCGSDGCGGTYNNCTSGYTCSNGQCVPSCTPYYQSNGCGSDGCGGTYNNCNNGYTCNNGQCVAQCYPTYRTNGCGSDGCGGTYNNCTSGYTCSNGQCVSSAPSCGSGYSGYYLPQTVDLPLPNDMGPSGVSCRKTTGSSSCRVCAPPGRVRISTKSNYATQYYNFNVSVYCPQGKGSTYTTWNTYGSADCSINYYGSSNDVTVRASVCRPTDSGWVRYEWCDSDGYKGSWVVQYQGY